MKTAAQIEADDRFNAELRRVYGAGAGTARYFGSHTDAACHAALVAKCEADKAARVYVPPPASYGR
jgi:hypothetical protein